MKVKVTVLNESNNPMGTYICRGEPAVIAQTLRGAAESIEQMDKATPIKVKKALAASEAEATVEVPPQLPQAPGQPQGQTPPQP